jgi:O-methyltransferase
VIGFKLIEAANEIAEKFGFRVSRIKPFVDTPPSDTETYRIVKPFTMTSRFRVLELCNATRYVIRHNIPGAIVECGVWRGGSVMAVLRTLVECGIKDREIYLFDTFEGMVQPGEKDGAQERQIHREQIREDGSTDWCRSEMDEVRKNLETCGYPMERIHFVKGRVEQTIPAGAPTTIALLRLDTDWYESTKHELVHMYPSLVPGGVLILDDYGTWQGAYKAVNEYFAEEGKRFYLHKIDDAGRLVIKP